VLKAAARIRNSQTSDQKKGKAVTKKLPNRHSNTDIASDQAADPVSALQLATFIHRRGQDS
jgi:hypothetical protein